MREPPDFARTLDADSVARTSYHRLFCSRKREHLAAIRARMPRRAYGGSKKALATLLYQEPAGGRAARAKP